MNWHDIYSLRAWSYFHILFLGSLNDRFIILGICFLFSYTERKKNTLNCLIHRVYSKQSWQWNRCFSETKGIWRYKIITYNVLYIYQKKSLWIQPSLTTAQTVYKIIILLYQLPAISMWPGQRKDNGLCCHCSCTTKSTIIINTISAGQNNLHLEKNWSAYLCFINHSFHQICFPYG